MSEWQPSHDERELGIHEYVSPETAGIGGVLKRLAEDFEVHELDLAGTAIDLNASERASPPPEVEDDGDSENVDDYSIVRFVLHKKRMDTLAAVGVLSKCFGVPVRSFGFAGLKDHRAITAQEMTVRGVSVSAVRRVRHPHFRIGRVRHVDSTLKLGHLSGNRFTIVMRAVRGDAKGVNAALRALRKRGFINYYGPQRFGECATRNDEVGRRLLLGEYALTVDALLGPSETGVASQHPVSGSETEARAAWLHSGDARTALKLMPKSRTLEREVLAGLARLAAEQMPHEARCRLAVSSSGGLQLKTKHTRLLNG